MDRRQLLRLVAIAGLGAACGRLVTSETSSPSTTPSGTRLDPATPSARPPHPSPIAPTSPATSATPTQPPETSPEPNPEASPEASPEPTADPTEPDESSPSAAEIDDSGPLTLAVRCRADWDATPAGLGGNTHQVEGIVIHHSGVPNRSGESTAARLRGYQQYHRDQGWPDIAYHLAVDPDGALYDLRDATIEGDTFTEYDVTGWFLVLADGDYGQEEPTAALLAGLTQSVAWAVQHFGVPLDRVVGHRDLAATSCPGQSLSDRLPQIIRDSQHLVDTRTVDRTPCDGDQHAP